MAHIHAALAVVAAVSTIRCTRDEDKTAPDPVDKPYPSLILLLVLSLSVSLAPELSSMRRRHPRGHWPPRLSGGSPGAPPSSTLSPTSAESS